ncbi:OmpA family protein [Roseinatronobacter sp. S2]|uniref:OmpA family protein n=1 Tax=Roseinatronobacter sp. S2 TaxID=3035471 RepID=UPI00240F1CA9|nr:OmpA family protein [Roseinatronobacter sp. S2]WFE73832.1 OmpA family protein [Roseinatronobacter sp. S2]
MNRRFFMLGAAGAGLAACGGPNAREAGLALDEGGFGNPTMHNTLVQTGRINIAEIMTRRFEAEVPAMVNFAFDSATLDAEAQRILRHQAHWMKHFPELRFRIFGHTDAVGSAAYNQRLGQRRADAARAYLMRQGVPRDSIIATVSRGESQPLIVTQGRERANRRTVTEIAGAIRRHPTVMNGEYARILHREYVSSAAPRPTLSENTL